MTLEYKGININYSDQGKGTAVVLLHGFLENRTMWAGIVPEIIKKNRVITVDLLGHGLTECLGYVHTMKDMADAVYAVISHLKLRKIILIGHSMGGYVALAFAEKYEHNVKALCLMNSTYLEDDKDRIALRIRANKMVNANFKNMIRLSFINLFSESSKTKYAKEIEKALNEALKTPLQGYIACNQGMIERKNRKDHFLNSSYKKMVIVGEKDPVINSKKLIKELQNTDVKVAEFPCGHMIHIENESLFLHQIVYFIENI